MVLYGVWAYLFVTSYFLQSQAFLWDICRRDYGAIGISLVVLEGSLYGYFCRVWCRISLVNIEYRIL
jgi:hypothetical protein